MYLVRTNDHTALEAIAANIDFLDDVPHCDLGDINGLALLELHPDSNEWMPHTPTIFDEESGLLICELAEEGLVWLKENAEQLTEFGADPEAVRAFATTQDAGQVYLIDTF